MPKFRKIAVEVDAWRFVNHDTMFLPDTMMPDWAQAACEDMPDSESLFIRTRRGVLEVFPGDWIVRGVCGDVYPLSPEFFEVTHNALEGE